MLALQVGRWFSNPAAAAAASAVDDGAVPSSPLAAAVGKYLPKTLPNGTSQPRPAALPAAGSTGAGTEVLDAPAGLGDGAATDALTDAARTAPPAAKAAKAVRPANVLSNFDAW